jgi:hypothetical protein
LQTDAQASPQFQINFSRGRVSKASKNKTKTNNPALSRARLQRKNKTYE